MSPGIILPYNTQGITQPFSYTLFKRYIVKRWKYYWLIRCYKIWLNSFVNESTLLKLGLIRFGIPFFCSDYFVATFNQYPSNDDGFSVNGLMELEFKNWFTNIKDQSIFSCILLSLIHSKCLKKGRYFGSLVSN